MLGVFLVKLFVFLLMICCRFMVWGFECLGESFGYCLVVDVCIILGIEW